MKFHTLFILVFFLQPTFSQINPERKADYLKDIQVLEMKAARKKMNYQANSNTVNYDVKYTRLELDVDPTEAFISGSITPYYEAISPMNSITFDLASNMTVSEVKQTHGFTENILSFNHTGDELIITLPNTLNEGVLDSLTISYSGNPVSSGFGSFEVNTHGPDNTPILWTLSEPYGAKGWWPCKQDLIDKIEKIDIYITHPTAYKAVSNGLLISETVDGTNTISHWKHQHPIPAYLIAIAVTNYEVYTNHVANGDFDVVNYVYPENLTNAQSKTNVTPPIMDLFGGLFEMYPYADEKYGHAQFGWGGGMEHTTISFMNNFSRGLIAHELAHQWFGDKITCGSWGDIWLNEGFATYLSGLVVENFDGNNAFNSWKLNKVNHITSQIGGSVFVTDTTSVNRIFDSRLSYSKGAMVLHMLRYKLGDIDFFQSIKNYLADPSLSYGYAKTEHLIEHFENQSGEDLTEFFNDWFTGQGYPSFNAVWNQNESGVLTIRVQQTQSHPATSFFETPIPVRVTGSGESEMLRLELTENNQLFSQNIDFEVTNIEIDPNSELISKYNTTVLGTSSILLEVDITIYPNPVTSSLQIKSTNAIEINEINIYNDLGQNIKTIHTGFNTISLIDLPQGVYIIKIATDLGVTFRRVLKK